MPSSSPKSLLLVLSVAGLLFSVPAAAQVCAHGETADVQVSVYVQDRVPYIGDATLAVTVRPFSEVPVEPEPCDPEVEDCDADACDPEVEDCEIGPMSDGEDCDPELQTCDEDEPSTAETVVVPVGVGTLISLPVGFATIEVSVPGFETKTYERTLCGTSTFVASLIPASTSTLELSVAAADDRLSAEGAIVVLSGEGPRASETFEAVVEGGTVEIADIPAGLYSLSVVEASGAVVQRGELRGVDLYEDTKLSLRLLAADDLPSTYETCSTSGSSLAWVASLLTLLAVASRRRLRGA